tara:strand:+ start:219 stop:692 length:474 start_codon:yes stop_codon:yes gene_type:complete
MNNKYINFYNNLINLTRNKILYKEFTSEDTFSDRLVIFLFHFAFFLNEYKSDSTKITLQELFDYVFKQLELSIREIGYGDVTINKKMKNYINTFYSILGKIDNWEKLDKNTKNQIFYDYLNIEKKPLLLSEYFENYRDYLKKNTFNSLLKGVINPKI